MFINGECVVCVKGRDKNWEWAIVACRVKVYWNFIFLFICYGVCDGYYVQFILFTFHAMPCAMTCHAVCKVLYIHGIFRVFFLFGYYAKGYIRACCDYFHFFNMKWVINRESFCYY